MNPKSRIAVSFDRTIYPLNAVMHIRANVDKESDKLPIRFIIYDFNKKLILSKTLNTQKTIPVAFTDKSTIYQTSFKMDDSSWRVGEQYTVIAKCGDGMAYSYMTIAKRNSVILFDKSVYMLGSDAIITIIAPDFDLDNEKAETIGNRKDNSVIVSTSKGKISEYALRETGNSTGIFQGVIGFMPPTYSKNGKKSYPKSKGKGPNDGYISATIDDTVTIEFKNKHETVKTQAHISNLGATIELDKKIYNPGDKVYLTIVAPDYNFNSNRIDSIGGVEDCEITISTSSGTLHNYNLKETGKDTGIFAGELELVLSKSKVIAKGKGSTNEKLPCQEEDNLIVTFVFENQKYVASALIKQITNEYELGKLKLELKNLHTYLLYIQDNVAQFNELPPPEKGSGIAPKWTDAEKDIFLRMELESSIQVLTDLRTRLEISKKLFPLELSKMILDITKHLENTQIIFKNDKAYFAIKPLKIKIMKLLTKLPDFDI